MTAESDGDVEQSNRSVTLRILVDGASATATTSTMEHLAAANGITVGRTAVSRGDLAIDWLDFQAGWYDGAQLRLEVFAAGGPSSGVTKGRALAAADAVIYAADGDRLAESATKLTSSGLLGPGSGGPPPRPFVVFALLGLSGDAATPEPTTDQVLAALRTPPETPLAMITDDGGGIRYGLALAVRRALDAARLRDESGRERRLPTTPEALAKTLMRSTDGDGQAAGLELADRPQSPEQSPDRPQSPEQPPMPTVELAAVADSPSAPKPPVDPTQDGPTTPNGAAAERSLPETMGASPNQSGAPALPGSPGRTPSMAGPSGVPIVRTDAGDPADLRGASGPDVTAEPRDEAQLESGFGGDRSIGQEATPARSTQSTHLPSSESELIAPALPPWLLPAAGAGLVVLVLLLVILSAS